MHLITEMKSVLSMFRGATASKDDITKAYTAPSCGILEVVEISRAMQEGGLNRVTAIDLTCKSRISIGRLDDSTIVCHSRTVSNQHCLIWVVLFNHDSVPLVYLKDMSLNGTFLNFKKLSRGQVVLLKDGDTISVADELTLIYSSVFGSCECDIGRSLLQDLDIEREFGQWEITDRVLGSGTFGNVFACESKSKGGVYAAKVMKKPPSNRDMPFEARVLSKLSHPNIITVFEACTLNRHLYIVEELVCGGDLFSYLSDGVTLRAIPEFEALVITYQIMEALGYLHKSNIVHRDLKLDNILMESPYPFTKIILADFGIATSFTSTKKRMFTTVGTPEYCAPEVGFKTKQVKRRALDNPELALKCGEEERFQQQGYDYKCDIWSLGVIVHIMLSGVSPFFEDGNEENMIEAAQRGQLNLQDPQWHHVTSHAKSFVKKTLRVDTNRRLNIDLCMAHPWIRKHSKDLAEIYHKIVSSTTTAKK